MTDALTAWIRTVHAALRPGTNQRVGAMWGPVRMAHSTTRPEWFASIDRAWACPADSIQSDGGSSKKIRVSIITAAFTDLPAHISPPLLNYRELGLLGEVPITPGCATRMTWNGHNGEVLAWDPLSGCALLLRPTPLNGYDLVSPMRCLVHWAVTAAGGVLMHAASVGRKESGLLRGALLIGKPGYGKSTTTLACLSQGWLTCGDDAVAVIRQEGGWVAHAIYAAVKTKLAQPDVAPPDLPTAGVESVTWDVAGTKRAHLLTSTNGQTLCANMRIASMILLDPDASPQAECISVSPAVARTKAATSTLCSLPFEHQIALRRIGQLASGVPATLLPRRLTLAETVSDVAAILRQ